ncbi:hypothetical protein [Luteimonas terricola]|uniref:Uncharacterized protein n=1 Tax=Luteimonas terricola TaxID=645597 RepID=A0ABQ2EFB7_9GAMM|nr:hypothetical protein [Luteimonas terricola]GGK09354.1 hypothetical protein GCM10011394_18530 [Luteimonas terricola]
MKVQLQGQSLRLRIGEDELAWLLAGETIGNDTQAGSAALRQRLRIVPGDAAVLAVDAGEWAFSLPEAAVRDYVARLPCRDALEFELPGDGDALRLSFEVDVRDSVRRRGPPPRRKAQRPD